MFDLRNLTISSTNPCLIIYLLDQSGSMGDKFGNANHTKAEELAQAINDIIYNIGLRCVEGPEIKNRFELAVIGYGKVDDKVESAWEGALTNKWVVSIRNIFDNSLGVKDMTPVWIRPYANGSTPMKKGFENARRLCQDWIAWGNHRDCHPPIIINITDGEATDSGSNYASLKKEVEMLKQLGTNYGQVNVFNIHISSTSADRQLFPSELRPSSDQFARLLFEMSTNMGENMLRMARQEGYDISNGAKGYVFNGNASDLIKFLNIGTPR